MGNKSLAKEMMKRGRVAGDSRARTAPSPTKKRHSSVAATIGYPVIIKASSGWGRQGHARRARPEDLANSVLIARAEAESAFGDACVYLEKYLTGPRHVEVQLLGDNHGNVVHLGERDCSVQRRHQKLIEESPCRPCPGDLRQPHPRRRGAGRAGRWSYYSAGTMEFLVQGDEFFFMEMNTRIQVEHPVTEMVTGRDLIKEMIAVAAGEPLSFAQEDVRVRRARHRVPHQRRGPDRRTSCPARARSISSTCRAGWACASTRTSTRGTPFRRTTTR